MLAEINYPPAFLGCRSGARLLISARPLPGSSISESDERMDRTDLQRLSKDELIELVIELQRPDKTSRNSSKPPSTDKKAKRENARPGGAKPGHEPHNRRLADNPDEIRDHKPTRCAQCGGAFSSDADMELIGEYDEIEVRDSRFRAQFIDRRRLVALGADHRQGGVQQLLSRRSHGAAFGWSRDAHSLLIPTSR